MTDYAIKITRSKKRKKTIQSNFQNNQLTIYLPQGLSTKEEQKWISLMMKKHEKHTKRNNLNSDGLLQKRAQELNKHYFEGKLTFAIKYVSNQQQRFGSCTPEEQTIRISDRVAALPAWVRDYILLHEMTHLVYPNHSKEFWETVNKFTYTERAKGYLLALGKFSEE